MGSVGCLAKSDIFFWQNILKKNRSKYTGDISEQSVVCTVLISAIIIEIFRKKNIPISYIIPYKNLASPLIPVCLKKSHVERNDPGRNNQRRVGETDVNKKIGATARISRCCNKTNNISPSE